MIFGGVAPLALWMEIASCGWSAARRAVLFKLTGSLCSYMTKLSNPYAGRVGEEAGRRVRENRSGQRVPLIHREEWCFDNPACSIKARTDWILGETLLLEADKLCWWPQGTRWRRRKGMLMWSNVWCYCRLREIASALHLKYLLSLFPTVCFTVSMSQQHHIWLRTVVTVQKGRLINVWKGAKAVIAVTRSILRAYTHTEYTELLTHTIHYKCVGHTKFATWSHALQLFCTL